MFMNKSNSILSQILQCNWLRFMLSLFFFLISSLRFLSYDTELGRVKASA